MFLTIIALGNLGGDPELRYMPDGTAVANFSMAVNRRWTSGSGEAMEETTWLRVSAWGKMAENVNQYLRKGNACLVQGRLRPDPATGGPRVFLRSDGSAGATYELHADNVRFVNQNNGGSGGRRSDYDDPVEEDSIPF